MPGLFGALVGSMHSQAIPAPFETTPTVASLTPPLRKARRRRSLARAVPSRGLLPRAPPLGPPCRRAAPGEPTRSRRPPERPIDRKPLATRSGPSGPGGSDLSLRGGYAAPCRSVARARRTLRASRPSTGSLVPGDDAIQVDPARLAALEEDATNLLLVCAVGDRVVATAFLTICPDPMYGAQPYGLVENVVVLEQHRGRGVGKALLAAVDEHARAARCTELMLLSARDRGEAHTFFERVGFDGERKRGFVEYLNRDRSSPRQRPRRAAESRNRANETRRTRRPGDAARAPRRAFSARARPDPVRGRANLERAGGRAHAGRDHHAIQQAECAK